jgi:hypothetical protein
MNPNQNYRGEGMENITMQISKWDHYKMDGMGWAIVDERLLTQAVNIDWNKYTDGTGVMPYAKVKELQATGNRGIALSTMTKACKHLDSATRKNLLRQLERGIFNQESAEKLVAHLIDATVNTAIRKNMRGKMTTDTRMWAVHQWLYRFLAYEIPVESYAIGIAKLNNR